ncbi:MAG: hypothetical protein ACI4B3_03855 [Prevotella sp.]
MNMKRNLFRKETLDVLENPGQINDFIRVTTPPLYIALLAMVICSVVVCLWLAFGTLTEHVKAVAVVFPHQTPTRVCSERDGSVEKLFVVKGETVTKGMSLLAIRSNETLDTVCAETSGMVIDCKMVDETFRAHETLAEIIPDKKNSLNRELITYVKYKDLRELRTGQEVQVTPVDLHREDYGYIIGHITKVDHFPTRLDDARSQSAIRNFIDTIFPDETAYEVRIMVDTDPSDSTRLKWSRMQSNDIRLSSMSFCNIQIITERKPVYKMFLRF